MTLRGNTTVSGEVISAAIAVHRELGPGLDEANYEAALAAELKTQGIAHAAQWPLPLRYKGVRLDCGYRIDLVVEEQLVVECKSVELIHPVHEAQLLTYLRLSGKEVGVLINFDVPKLKKGLRRMLWSAGHARLRGAINSADDPSLHRYDDSLTGAIVAAALEVHCELGPGLLRSAYEECLCYELSLRGVQFTRKSPLQLRFRNIELPGTVEVPLLVESEVPVMCLSVGELTPLHAERLRGFVKHGNWRRGLILNFNVLTLLQGIRRVMHNPE